MRKILTMTCVAVAVLCAVLFVNASTYTNFTGSATSLPNIGVGVIGFQSTVDFLATPLASNDVLRVVGLPKNATLLAVSYDVTKTNTCTPGGPNIFTVGDDWSAARYSASVSMAAVTSGVVSATGYTYPGANSINITAKDAVTSGVVVIWGFIGSPHQ